jgi:hypothetical protein
MLVGELLQEVKLKTYLSALVDKHGIKKLGGGAFSQVFQHPVYKNVVVKVYKASDTVYKKYVAWCLKNQSNPYVPKIIEQNEYKSPKGDAYNIVFMQKMRPASVKTFKAQLRAAMPKAKDIEFEDLDIAIDDYDMVGMYEELNRLIPLFGNNDLKSIWGHIRSYGKAKFDLHPGNVMMRDGQLVLTDPVALDPTNRVDEF